MKVEAFCEGGTSAIPADVLPLFFQYPTPNTQTQAGANKFSMLFYLRS